MVRQWLLASAASVFVLTASATASQADNLLPLTLTDAPPSSSTTSSQFYGSINPFYGSINPFYGSINPFYGSINPFWGDINPFWGDINPFYGDINPFYGSINPFWGDINPFTDNAFWPTVMPYWRNAGPQWGNINQLWNQLQAANATDYSGLQSQLNDFFGQSAAFWGSAVQQATGKSFDDGFANAMLAKYGIDPNNPASLASATPVQRSAFFLNWYDGLMSFTGVDHVDWWMAATHWSPSLAQIQGGGTGAPTIVGLLDSSFSADNSDVGNLQFVGGYKYYVNDHGAAVASLIAAEEDGQGVMGVAPNVDIRLYNPFDTSGTASWTDVANGISKLYSTGAHVVNASLGVPGSVLSPEWSSILTGSLLKNRTGDLVVVKAAGNEGVTQTQNVAWGSLSLPSNLILVGSVGPTNTISYFSNRPGNACITILGLCVDKLMNHFIVAPGELMLVEDNHGGVTRMSGTSFAAPLVTGAVALLQSRWPWLEQHAPETVQIILQSADDLGAPGVDPVYGWGELDIQKSQSPLNFDNLMVYQPFTYSNGANVNSPLLPNWSAHALKAAVLNPGQLALWQNNGAYIVAFESIGTTYRDFTIPLSSLLVGKSQKVNGTSNRFQSYLYQQMIDWANGVQSLSYTGQSLPLGDGAWSLSMTATQSTFDEERAGYGPFQPEFVAINHATGLSLTFGEGSGAHALTGIDGFAMRTDFDPATGGVNPVLGLASGGAYARSHLALGAGFSVNFGISQKSDDHTFLDPTFGPLRESPLAPNRSFASVMDMAYAPSKDVQFDVSYTDLNEADALLGAQGGGALDFTGGSHTGALTVGTTAKLGDGWQISGSATMARTEAPGLAQSLFTLTKNGLTSMAFELVAAKSGLFDDTDQFRLTLSQPLHVESGGLTYRSLQVVDRSTGALGLLDETWNIAGNREYRFETLYDMPVLDGRGAVDGFSIVDVNDPLNDGLGLSLTVGARFRTEF